MNQVFAIRMALDCIVDINPFAKLLWLDFVFVVPTEGSKQDFNNVPDRLILSPFIVVLLQGMLSTFE